MRKPIVLTAALTALALFAPIAVARGQAVVPAIPQPAPIEAAKKADEVDPPLPPIAITESSLDDVLDAIKDRLPSFNAVVIRDPGVPADYPKLRNMKTDNITVSQFMEFLDKGIDGINVVAIGGTKSNLFVIKVHNPQAAPGAFGGPTPAAMASDSPVVIIFPLREVIPEIASHQNDPKYTQKQAMDDILSLLQAALKAESHGAPAEIQVHEATEMLVVKGTAEEVQLVSQTLAAFAPSDQEKKIRAARDAYEREIAQQKQRSQAEMAQLQQQLNNEVMRSDEYQNQLQHAEQQLMKLQGAAGAATQPKQ